MWISSRYPAIEILNGVLWVGLYWIEVPSAWDASIAESGIYSPMGPQGDSSSMVFSPEAVVHWRYFYHLVLIEALIVATFIDWDLWIIPDGVTLPAMAVGVLGGFLIGRVHLVPVWFQSPTLQRDVSLIRELSPEAGWMFPDWMDPLLGGAAIPAWVTSHPHLHGLAASVAGLLVGGGITWTVRFVGTMILKREAMGDGDVVLMAMVGSFLGWQPTIAAFLLAPVAACAVALVRLFWNRQVEIPYGPYLSLGTLAVLLGWETVWPPFERVFQAGVLVLPVGLAMILGMALMLMLIQLLKQAFGIELYEAEPQPVWLASDQTHYYGGEQVDQAQGNWRRAQWPGILSSRGQIHEAQWRRPE